MAVIGPKRLPDIINPSCMIVAEMYWMANAYAIVRIPNPATGKELHRIVQVYFVVWRKNTNKTRCSCCDDAAHHMPCARNRTPER